MNANPEASPAGPAASSWSALLPAMLAVLRDGDSAGRRIVAAELQRMAAAADIGNQALVSLVRLSNSDERPSDADAIAVINHARACSHPCGHRADYPADLQPGLPQIADIDSAPAPVISGATIGAMAKRIFDRTLELQICYSAAGFYLGTYDEDGPCTRESAEYWTSREAAARALESGVWTQRDRP